MSITAHNFNLRFKISILAAIFIVAFLGFVKNADANELWINNLSNETLQDTWNDNYIGETFLATTTLDLIMVSFRGQSSGWTTFNIVVCSGIPQQTSADRNCSGSGQTLIVASSSYAYYINAGDTNYTVPLTLSADSYCNDGYYIKNMFYTISSDVIDAKWWLNNNYLDGYLFNSNEDDNSSFYIESNGYETCTGIEVDTEEKLWFYWPVNGIHWSNSTSTEDYQLMTNLDLTDIYDTMFLRVNSVDSNNNAYLVTENITGTTSLALWPIERQVMDEGLITTNAELWGANEEMCYSENNCNWTIIATAIVWWYNDTEGWSLYENPILDDPDYIWHWGGTSTDIEDDEWWLFPWTKLKKLFPLNMIFQMRDIMEDFKDITTTTPALTYGDLITDNVAGDYKDSVIISSNLINDETYGNFWHTYVYNPLYFLTYALTFFIVLRALIIKKEDD